MKTQIYLVRHGQTDWNKQGRYQGSSDIHLNKKGLEEARKVADLLSRVPFKSIYSSPLTRAKKTAEELTRHHRLPVVIVDELRERSYGTFEGYTFEQIQGDPIFKNSVKGEWYLKGSPDGETFDDATYRISKALIDIVQKHKNETIGIVAHGGVIKSIGVHIGHLGREYLPNILIPNAKPILIEYSHIEKRYTVIDFPFSIRN